jgi:hypothetical protein
LVDKRLKSNKLLPMINHLKVICVLGVSAFLATGCNLNMDPGGDDGGTAGNCLASVVSDVSGSQLPLNTNVTTPAGTGISSTVAEAFTIPAESRAVSKVTLKLDVVAPQNTYLSGAIHVAIYPDATFSTSGQASPTLPNLNAPYVDVSTGTAANSTSVSASSISPNGPQWYDFCFDGASGDGCSGNRGGVTFKPGQVYWIVISGAPAGGKSSFLEWRGNNAGSPNSVGEIQTSSGFLPVNTPSTSYNFDFKVGC